MLASSPWNSFVTAKDAFTPCASIGSYYLGAIIQEAKGKGLLQGDGENRLIQEPNPVLQFKTTGSTHLNNDLYLREV